MMNSSFTIYHSSFIIYHSSFIIIKIATKKIYLSAKMTKTTLTTSFKQTRSIWLLVIWSLTFGTAAFAQQPTTPPATQPAAPAPQPTVQPAAPAAQPATQPAAPKPTTTPAPTTTTTPALPAGLTVQPIYLPAEPTVVRKKPAQPRRVDSAARAAVPATATTLPADTAKALTTVTPVKVDTPKVPDPTVPILSKSDNPFDILRDGAKTDSAKASGAKSSNATTGNDPIRLVFWLWLGVSLLLAFVSITSGHIISQVYRSLASDSSLRLIYKGYSGWGNFAYITLYFICWMNVAIFAYLMLHRYKGGFGMSSGKTFLICFTGVALFFLIKHLFLYILSTVFPLEKEIKLYNFIVMGAGILTGLALTPLNIFMAYSPTGLSSIFMYLAIAAIFVIFLLRALRGLFVGASYLSTHPFHFLLYLCTAEIAPLAVLAKLVLLKSGI
jgi:cytoskeletal protein RodZ